MYIRVIIMIEKFNDLACFIYCSEPYIIINNYYTNANELHMHERPYVKDLYNNVEALTFTILGTINIISIFNYLTAARGQPLSSWLFAIQYCFVFLPLAWMIVGILYFYIYRKGVREKFQSVREKLVKLPYWQKKDEQDDVPLTSIIFSAECVQADDITESVHFFHGEDLAVQ